MPGPAPHVPEGPEAGPERAASGHWPAPLAVAVGLWPNRVTAARRTSSGLRGRGIGSTLPCHVTLSVNAVLGAVDKAGGYFPIKQSVGQLAAYRSGLGEGRDVVSATTKAK